ncbi:MAG: hypothetical protein J7604_25765 [Sporocytophaga sp.]|uniref:hypothetical protein n=1 Tax=Sporocytophaga sp. TaxID=2231183 RepID=UPI001B2A5F42|nr:hypothetical protein [Sporocytophaga sp.]MBO9703638.1 hypothetical protein [Sporocytophaga sp.]
MKYIKITWIRVVISLFSGGLICELIHMLTGEPNKPETSNLSLLYTLIIYAFLTYFVKKSGRTLS